MHKNFVIKKKTEINEIQATLVELEHRATGAQVIHLANDDPENLFNLSFRTWPESSNGVAHILEHTVLCGSEHFPIRDPFFEMTRRSLNTFMNALTGADFTCYPASSMVEGDFYNLLAVYLDAVFKPKLTRESFLQEGHRLEFLTPDDPNTPLVFKGVVFNEMKGAMASGEARLSEELMQGLFPDVTYGVNSGGDPKEIPALTYEELQAFHAKFYHPSRCLFFFYGDLPLDKHLAFIEERALKGVERLPDLGGVPKQPRFTAPVKKTCAYPIADTESGEEKTLVGMSWLTCSILEQEELLALCVLDMALMGTDASPLKMALLRSGLCKQADSSIEVEMSEAPFTLVCKGVKSSDAEAIEEVVRTTLEQIVSEGLPKPVVDGSIHQLEMSRTEITGNSSPYGLNLFFRAALLKQHGGNPEDGLRVHTLFAQLRKNVENPKYLTGLIKKHLLDNPHYVRVAMIPDPALAQKEVEEETGVLAQICQRLKDPEVKQLLEQAKALENQEDGDANILPKVTLSDVAKSGHEFALEKSSIDGLNLYTHPCFTNDLLYADLVFDLPLTRHEDLSYLRLFSVLLPQMGCGGRSYAENLDYQLEHTGGIGVALDLGQQVEDPKVMRPSLSVRGKALYRKADKLFPLFYDLLTSADFTDVKRLDELLDQHFHALETAIQTNSLRYAVNMAARGQSVASTIVSRWYGLDYYWALKQIMEQDRGELIAKLQQMQERCLGLAGGELVLSCDEAFAKKLAQEKFYGLDALPSKGFTPWSSDYAIETTESQGRLTASPVAFTAQLFSAVNYTHPDAAPLSVASEIMENKVLHKRIREQGGAYGSGAVNGVLSGQFYFYAYRDPHLKSSLDAFQEAIDQVASGAFDASDIEAAQLGLFQEIDSPIPPGSRGMTAYGRLRSGRTPEVRQAFRERLMQVTKEQIQEAVKQQLQPKEGVCVAFAGKELLEKENVLPIYSV